MECSGAFFRLGASAPDCLRVTLPLVQSPKDNLSQGLVKGVRDGGSFWTVSDRGEEGHAIGHRPLIILTYSSYPTSYSIRQIEHHELLDFTRTAVHAATPPRTQNDWRSTNL